ncbi:Lrp/AsnC family transcriptional regulator [Paracoccus caeni]|uniref:Lrp/AsnC family transcriptional regulator n=1 Tax=Paracoccus caeni TaxID=657651 RepID=A0A934SMA7_9RHOB|nr:Lrp/AsnC family transcriptional regulator [Paracoccus caeni]MBK4217684.1 Lrp/AsnC family transcriptional regulator [Paracoccus caeni]
MRTIDETDLRILRAMQTDGNLTVTEIAERVGISQSPCSRRIASLQADGIIKGKRTILDPRKMGFHSVIIVRIKLTGHHADMLDQFKAAVRDIPEIQVALLVLGEFDFYLRIIVEDIDHYQRLMQGKLVALPGVREMQSSVILEIIKDSSALPL